MEQQFLDTPGLLERAGVNTKKLSQHAQSSRTLIEGVDDFIREPAYWMNGLELGLKDGDRLDQRNSAMSAVANLLGVPKLVARSSNMKFLDEDGNVVEGTFMEEAQGLDLRGKDKEELFTHVSDKPFDAESNLNRDLADIQVLDYICGNVDRHSGNLFYDVDTKTGKIRGVQGIDNDSAFGLFSSGKDGENFRLHGTDSLKVVSEGMAAKIQSISPEMLTFTLRGRGLSDKEIEAACTRLNDVKTAVKEAKVAKNIPELMENSGANQLSIVSEKNLSKIPINSFVKEGNLFNDVRDQVGNTLEKARQQGHSFKPEEKAEKKSGFQEVSTTSRRYTAAGIGESLRGMGRLIENRATGFVVSGLSKFLRSSGQFRTMVSSVKAARKLSEQVKKEVGENGAPDREDPKVKAQLEKADKAMEAVRKATDAYLAKKMKERNAASLDQLRGKNAYEQRRIDYAKKVLSSVKDYDRIAHPEKAAEQAEREAVKARAALAAQRQAKKAPQDPQAGIH